MNRRRPMALNNVLNLMK